MCAYKTFHRKQTAEVSKLSTFDTVKLIGIYLSESAVFWKYMYNTLQGCNNVILNNDLRFLFRSFFNGDLLSTPITLTLK